MYYEVQDGSSQVIETVWYAYNAGGHVQEIVRKLASGGTYYRTFFLYDKGGQLWIALKDQWSLSGSTPTSCTTTWAREFRYEGGQARYLMRPRDTTTLEASTSDVTWTDYDGVSVYGDYEVAITTGAQTEVTRYVMGQWQQDVSSGDESFLHGDLIGTTRLMTDDSGTVGREVVYTAFGEMVYEDGTLETRYGYAGRWGYEGNAIGTGTNSLWGSPSDSLGLLHVGARLYDPSIGRFIMRDPIGIRDGLNVYSYVGAQPVSRVDPTGLSVPVAVWIGSHFPGPSYGDHVVAVLPPVVVTCVGVGIIAGLPGGPAGSAVGAGVGIVVGVGASFVVGGVTYCVDCLTRPIRWLLF